MNMTKKIVKSLVLILSLILMTGIYIRTTSGFLASEDRKENVFTMGEVKSELKETFDGVTKSDVYVDNIGNVDMYTRADIVIYFEDENGKILPGIPEEGIDYSIELGDNWIKKGNQYYYKDIIRANESSTNLINTCTNLSNKKLVVEILTQSIQANTNDALIDAWGISDIE